MRPGLSGGLDHLFPGRVRMAIQYVVANRPVQQHVLLQDHPDLAAQTILCDLRDILPIDHDRAPLHVMKPQLQLEYGRFPGPGSADQADPLARPDCQVDMVQSAGLPPVVMRQATDVDPAL